MGPIWGRQDPGGPNVGLMSIALWECFMYRLNTDLIMLCYSYITAIQGHIQYIKLKGKTEFYIKYQWYSELIDDLNLKFMLI